MAGLNFGTGTGTGLGQDRTNLQNIDWLDTADSTGYVYFEGYSIDMSTGQEYRLVNVTDIDVLYSNAGNPNRETTVSGTVTNASYTKILDIDFDGSAFQLPKLVKGTALIKVHAKATETGGHGGDVGCYVVARIRKWDGATETEIASAQTGNITNSSIAQVYALIPIDMAAVSQIKAGEQLRLTIEVWAKQDSGLGHTVTLNHDPSSSDNRITFALPIRIEEK